MKALRAGAGVRGPGTGDDSTWGAKAGACMDAAVEQMNLFYDDVRPPPCLVYLLRLILGCILACVSPKIKDSRFLTLFRGRAVCAEGERV